MYKEERKNKPLNLKLNSFSKENLSRIINDSSTERIIISGEGEPFNNKEAVFEILSLSQGNKKIQILTNGLWILDNHNEEIFNKLNSLLKEKKDKYQIRISCDSFHIERIGVSSYKKIIEKVISELKNEENRIEICFRGILEEKEEILNTFKDKFLESENSITFKNISSLETDVYIGNDLKLNFIFKNIIGSKKIKKESTMNDYICSLEKIYNKPFTLGHLKTEKNGMDITIKPNGDLFFYGAEIFPLFNIFKDEIDIKKLLNIVENNPILKILYSRPFLSIIKNLKKYEPFNKIISSVDNPYWIIKKMYALNKNKFEGLIKCT
jgi:hypothetical protein